jgi:hypothetical protein
MSSSQNTRKHDYLECPKCGSQNIEFGAAFVEWRFWEQQRGEITNYEDFMPSDDVDVDESEPIQCRCNNLNCHHEWSINENVYSYLY